MTSPILVLKSASEQRSLSRKKLASLITEGVAHRNGNRFQEARDIFVNVSAICPTEPYGELGLGSTCFSEGRFDEAISHYCQALKLSPCNAYAYALLGESQIFKFDYPAARVSLRRACELDRKGPYGRLAQQLLLLLDSLRLGAAQG